MPLPKRTPPPPPSPPRLPALLPLAAFLLLAAVALGWNLAAGSLLPSDDAIYARAALEALREGRWLDVTWGGRPLFEKGPVLFWMLQGSLAFLGPTDLAVRLPGVAAGVALLAAAWLAARAAGASRGAALAGAALVLLLNLFVFNARRPMTDVPGAALGLAGFALAAFGRGAGTAVGAGALLGLSALVKVVAPAPAVLALLLLQADRGLRRPGRLAAVLSLAAAVALPWHLAMLAVHGRPFWDTYVGFHLLRRASMAVVGDGPEIYVAWWVEREGPGALLAGLAVAGAAVRAVRGDALSRAGLALLLGGALPLALSRTALPHYLVALLPGLALCAAATVQGVRDTVARVAGDRRRGAARGEDPGGGEAAPAVPGWVAASAALALAAVAFLGANARDLADPDYGPGTRDACAFLAGTDGAGPLAAAVDLHDPAVAWYCDRPVPFLGLDPGFLAATEGIPMLQGVVAPLDPATLRSLGTAGAWVLTVPPRLPALGAAAAAAGVRLSDPRSFPGRTLVRLSLP